MSINGISGSNYIAPSTVISGTANAQANTTSDPNGDDGVKRSHGHGHGHGQMQAALMQALQSLGLSPTQQTDSLSSVSGATSTSSGSGSTDSDGDNGGTASKTGSVKNDMRHFMHALFQAVKSEGANGSSGSVTGSTDPKANFASGLSALITQVSNGSAPTDLQNAFSKVVTDMQATSAVPSTTTSGSTSSTPQATLQAMLTQLQQNLGYGAASSTAAIGNLLNAQG